MAQRGPTLGSVFVEIGGDAAPFVRDFQNSLKGLEASSSSLMGSVSTSLNTYGNKVLGTLGTVFKRGSQVVAAAIATTIGLGVRRLAQIEEARAKLLGLGHDAAAVDAIMENALASVLGTAYGLGDAATIAASAVAAGVKPGKDLERTLKLVGDAAYIAGYDLQSMGAIFEKIAAGGRLTGRELQQLTNSGIPVLQWLQEEFGLTAEAAREMVRKGQVDFDVFRDIVEKNIGGAALRSAETTMGAFRNMGAAASRLGAELAGPVFRQARTFFIGVIGFLDWLTNAIKPTMAAFEKWLIPATQKAGFWLQRFGEGVRGITRDVGPLAHELGGVGDTARQFGLRLRAAFLAVAGAVKAAVGFYREHEEVINRLVRAVVPAVAIVTALAAGMAAWGKVAAVVAAGTMGPVLALMALASALMFAYQNSEQFREGVGKLMSALADVGGGVFASLGEGFASFRTQLAEGADVLSAFQSAWETFTAGLRSRDIFGDLRASFDDLLTWLTGDGIPSILTFLVESKVRFVETAIRVFSGLAEGLTAVLPGLIEAVARAVPQVVNALVAAVPLLVDGAVQLFMGLLEAVEVVVPEVLTAVVQAIPVILAGLVEAAPRVLGAGIQLFNGLVEAVLTVLPMVVEALVAALPLLVDAIVTFIPQLLDAGLQFLLVLVDAVLEAFPQVVDALVTALPMLVGAITDAAPQLLEAGTTFLLSLVEAVTTVFPDIVAAVVAAIPLLLQAIIDSAAALVEAGITMFLGLVDAVTEAFPQVVAALVEAFPLIIGAIADAFPQLLSAGIELFLALVEAVATALPDIIAAIAGAIPQVLRAIVDALPLIIEAGITLFLGLVDAIAQALPDIIDALVAAMPELLVAIVEALPLIIEAGVMLFLGLVDAITQALPAIIDAIIAMGPSLVAAIFQLGTQLWFAALDAFVEIARAVEEAGYEVLAALGDVAINVVTWANSLPGKIVDALSELGDRLVQWARDALTRAWESFKLVFGNAPANSILGWFKTLPSKLLQAVRQLPTMLGRWAREALTNAWRNFQTVWNSVITWFRGLPQRVVTAVTSLIARLGTWARDAMVRARTNFQERWATIISWFRELPERVVTAVTSLIAKMGTWGRKVMSGAWDGLKEKWRDVLSWFRDLPQKIIGAIPNPGSILKSVGSSIMGGLAEGISNATSKVTGAVSGVLSRARGLLPSSPAKYGPFSGKGWTLYSGRAIAEALAKGMFDQRRLVQAAARSLARAGQVAVEGPEFGAAAVRARRSRGSAAEEQRRTEELLHETKLVRRLLERLVRERLLVSQEDIGRAAEQWLVTR
jgi:tape measure domain-containing protein